MQRGAREEQLDFVGDLPDPGDAPVIRPHADSVRYDITPVTKPRQTKQDKWKKRPCVEKYREYADKVRDLGITLDQAGDRIIFVLPMPKSWSQKKRNEMRKKLYDAQDEVDNRKEELIQRVEAQLKQKTSLKELFKICWKVI